MPASPITTAVLRGPEHVEYGRITTCPLGDRAAIGLSIGAFPKGYPALDPNEDGALAATDGKTTLLAVTDGHNGFDAADATLTAIAEQSRITLQADPAAAKTTLTAVVTHASAAIRQRLSIVGRDRSQSRTTLAVALVHDRSVTVMGCGDSSVFLVRGSRVRRLVRVSPFLGPDPVSVEPVTMRLRPDDLVLLGTDGLFDFLGSDWKHAILDSVDRSDLPATIRHLVTRAGQGGAGDNVAVALATRHPAET
jgi:serine/threonine protein phosphatase PrpC